MEDSEFSLLGLEEELTCCICLSTFDCPVTIPCGHNFCQDCLLSTWKDSYSCPQCRTHFATKPELKKNTVLSTVVQTFNQRRCKSETSLEVEETKAEKQHVIRCDTCMEAEAAQTCLTCMASFCEEHLRPHRDNPRFSVHQLSAPVGDLSERICPDHHKLMELFCSQHGRPICSLCLQQVHKGCTFMSPEEQRTLKESDLRSKLGLLDGKIMKTETVLVQVNDTQSKLKDAATQRKMALAAAYQQMKDMLEKEECEAQRKVDCELETCQTKLQDQTKRLTENNEKLTKAKESINSLLSQSQTPAFLKARFNLPKVAKAQDPSVPQISLDSKKVTAAQAFSAALKEHLTEILTQPVEARLPLVKPVEEVPQPPKQRSRPRSRSAGRQPIQPTLQPVPPPMYPFAGPHSGWHHSQYAPGGLPYMAKQNTKRDNSFPNAPRGFNNPTSHHSSQFNKY